MSVLKFNKGERLKSFSKNLFTSSATSVLSSFAFMAVAQTAHAQVAPVIIVDACSEFTDNPLTDDGGTIQVFLANEGNQTCTVSNGDNISLDDGQDNVTINIASGVTLNNTDTSDEDVVIFIDNSENNNRVNIGAGAVLTGANGVIFIEGDGTTVVNNGRIVSQGLGIDSNGNPSFTEEGAIYIDRDTDSDEILIVNGATGEIISQDNGPAIGIELLIADGTDNTESIGVQSPVEDFPTVRIVNRAGGLIQTTGTLSDDNDAINIAGSPGTTGGDARACIEGEALNCQINLSVSNFGTIRSIFDNSGSAGITFEDDAVFNGLILNHASGLITGTRNGIRIGDIEVDGATAEHTGGINNAGTISGTGEGSRGIDLEGDGVTIANNTTGVISGLTTGIEVGAGSSGGIEHSGVNNTIVNRGTISGGSFSVDSSNAEGGIRIISVGGSFDGNIRGSIGNADFFGIRGGVTDLTNDVLNGFEVRTLAGGELNFVGDRTIEGSLINGATVRLDLSNTQTVTGDVRLRVGSTVAITDTTSIAGLGEEFTLISVGGTLVNNGVLDTSDESLLLDFEFVDSNDLVIEAIAAGGGSAKTIASSVSFTNAATESFGETVLGAFVDGGLNGTAAFSNLVALSDGVSVGNVLESLAPDFSGSLAQNVYNSVQNGSAQIDQRLNDLNCNHFYDGRETASLNASAAQGCQSFAETGSWIQSTTANGTQGNLSLSASTYFNDGSERDSVTMTYGYDQALSNDTVVGLSGNYTKTEADNGALSVSSTDLDVVQFSAYAGHRIGNLNLVTKASYSAGEAETNRQSFEVIKADVGFQGVNVQSVASYDVDLGKGLYLKPEAGFLYDNVTTSAFSESGGLNLNVSGTSSNVLDARAGLTLGARRQVSDSLRADVYVTAAVVDDLYGKRDDLGYSFGGQSGSLASRSLNNFGVQGLMGVNLLSTKNFSFGAAVNSEFSDTETAVGSSVKTQLRW